MKHIASLILIGLSFMCSFFAYTRGFGLEVHSWVALVGWYIGALFMLGVSAGVQK